MIYKKGAMFGLDARIALAIFGALSVISGASLYSVINNVTNEKYNQEMIEIIKATEAYYLDTGERLPMFNTSVVDYTPLIVNDVNAKNWNGPYISLTVSGSISLSRSLMNNAIGGGYINGTLYPGTEWPDDSPSCVVNDYDCLEYIKIYSGNGTQAVKLKAIFSDLDEHIDGGDGPLKGKLRLTGDGVVVTRMFYKGIPRKKTS